ncbi:MAG: ATP-dependent RNA helicase HrpA [Chitinivibrionales bacterium]|nr:ATP-dependent RNA helicase HrpA [Chitinivibrionales bacterium]
MPQNNSTTIRRKALSHKPEQPFVNNSVRLPIYEKRDEILDALAKNRVIIVAGETGSGKTTQLPLMCREAGRGRSGKIGITQPRRIAALSIARHVASCLNTPVGETVGYKVRFHEQVSKNTAIQFMTDGMLLAEIAESPDLKQYDTLIIDEAHERSCNIDFILGYLRMLLQRRDDLQVIISSATMDTQLFSRAFNHAPIITVSGRLYPVSITYKPAIEMWDGEGMRTYADVVVSAIREIIDRKEDGDILAFLPTARDILETISGLKGPAADDNAAVLPLYSRLSLARQKKIFQPLGKRKIVVATNIAETSLTVPGIRFVVDTGLARKLRYEPHAGASRMPVERVSKASADQRTGRCGRVRDGECIRLYSFHDYDTRPKYTTPEIRRANLASVILTMSSLHLGDAENFPFLQRPSRKALSDGYYQLRELGAITRERTITSLGRKMAAFPLDPPIARMLLYAQHHSALREMCIIAAALSVVDPRTEDGDGSDGRTSTERSFIHPESDFMTLIALWNSHKKAVKGKPAQKKLMEFCKRKGLSYTRIREWIDVHDQIVRILHSMRGFKMNSAPASYVDIHKSLLCGLMANVAVRQENKLYQGTKEHDIMIFPGSTLFGKEPKWVLFHELVETRRLYGRTAAVIRPQWIEELFAKRCTYSYKDPFFDHRSGIIRAREQVTWKGLTIVHNRMVNYSVKKPEHASKIFIQQALVEEKAGNKYRFIRNNHDVKEKILRAQEKLRTKAYYAGDALLADFYEERLKGVAGLRDLNKAIAKEGSDKFLCIDESELLAEELPARLDQYPDEIVIGTVPVEVSYAFSPDLENDGATITIPLHLYNAVPIYYWDWLLPVYWKERIALFAKIVRKNLPPGVFSRDIENELLHSLRPSPLPFITALRSCAKDKFGCDIPVERINYSSFPDHCWVRVRVVDTKGVIRDTFRLPKTTPCLPYPGLMKRPPFWAPHCSTWERTDIVEWDFDTTPETVALSSKDQAVPLPGYMALCREDDSAGLRVFFSRESADTSHAEGVRFLLEKALEEELAWACGSFSVPFDLIRMCSDFTDKKELRKTINRLAAELALELPETLPRVRCEFETLVRNASVRIPTAHREIYTWFLSIAREYGECKETLDRLERKHNDNARSTIADELYNELDNYLSRLFVANPDIRFIAEIKRYLKALKYRIETGFLKPRKYKESMHIVRAFRKELRGFEDLPQSNFFFLKKELRTLGFMIEEIAVALFTPQNMKTKFKISGNRIEKKISHIEEMVLKSTVGPGGKWGE